MGSGLSRENSCPDQCPAQFFVCVQYLYADARILIWRSDDHASWYILIVKPTRCTNFSNLFWNKTLHVSDSSSVHRQEFHAVHTAIVYVIQVLLTACKQDQDDTARKLSAKPVWHIPLLCVQHETPGDGQRNCPKHVEFYVLLTVHLITVFVNDQLDAQFFFLYLFVPIFYMFLATKCSSSGESVVSIQPLVCVTLKTVEWYKITKSLS